MKKNVIGTCGLCLNATSHLQQSHMIPAAAFKRLRDPKSKNPNPVWVTPKFVVQSSSQTQDYFLCWDCEQRLRANGEDWIMQNCFQPNKTFPLQEALRNTIPQMTSAATKMYAASKIKDIDVKKLAYFAGSVFWRASAHEWRTGNVRTSEKGFLGSYEDDFRKYLLGQQTFPSDAVLFVSVPVTEDAAFCSGIMAPHRGAREPSSKAHQFLFLGIGFDLFVGKGMDDFFRKHCFVRGDLITMTDILDKGIDFKWRAAAKGRALRE